MAADTETGKCAVTVDGETLDNVTNVMLYKGEDYEGNYYFGLEIVQNIVGEKGAGYSKQVRHYLTGTEEAKAALAKGGVLSASKRFVTVQDFSKIGNDLLEYLRQ
mgnify:CR=1 FL=1